MKITKRKFFGLAFLAAVGSLFKIPFATSPQTALKIEDVAWIQKQNRVYFHPERLEPGMCFGVSTCGLAHDSRQEAREFDDTEWCFERLAGGENDLDVNGTPINNKWENKWWVKQLGVDDKPKLFCFSTGVPKGFMVWIPSKITVDKLPNQS
jgi:hypothetical protein